jgi:predicted AAA+ superfamily ATPase
MISRKVAQNIANAIHKGKAIILLGARQTGKTTMLDELFQHNKQTLFLNGDDSDVKEMFEKASSTKFKTLFGSYNCIIIDEAQRIEDIGVKLKIITDNLKNVQLVATGSSAFELANKVNEPLTGRKWEFQLFPLSFAEMVAHHGIIDEQRLLEQRLVYGYYPEVVTHAGNEKNILKALTDSYLYKDILLWERIKKPEKLVKIMQALAFQIGNQVSYNELGQLAGLDNQTVESYIQLLEQTFVIFRLAPFSRNLRNELKNTRKIYFYDNGIRNALISSFNPISLRNDVGALWENFMIAERQKHLSYNNSWGNKYFWRTHEQQEIDYLEERDGQLHAYEIKWNPEAKTKFPKSFINAYPGSETKVIHPQNIEEFVM